MGPRDECLENETSFERRIQEVKAIYLSKPADTAATDVFASSNSFVAHVALKQKGGKAQTHRSKRWLQISTCI